MTNRHPGPEIRCLVNVALAGLALVLVACAGDGSDEDGALTRDAGTPAPTMRDGSPPVSSDAGPRPTDAGSTGSTDGSVASDAGAVVTDAGSACECAPEEPSTERCSELVAECEGGDDESCTLYEVLCRDDSGGSDGDPADGEGGGEGGGDPCACADAGTASCEDLLALCLGGDDEACRRYETDCSSDG